MNRRWLLLGLELVFFIAIVFKFIWGLSFYTDIYLYDEADYLNTGIRLLRDGITRPDWGPLYSVWYFLNSFIWPIKAELYFKSWQFLMVLNTFAVWGLFYVLKVGRSLRFLGTLGVLFSGLFFVWPHVTLLALFFIVTSVTVALKLKESFQKVAAIQIGFLTASFVRPEFFFGSLLFFVIWIWFFYRSLKESTFKKVLAYFLMVVVVFVGFIKILGIPLSNSRSLAAFSQHYSANQFRLGRFHEDPMAVHAIVFERTFGHATTLGQVLIANPKAFIEHVLFNIVQTPYEAMKLLPIYLSTSSFQSQIVVLSFQAVFFLCVLSLFCVHFLKTWLKRDKWVLFGSEYGIKFACVFIGFIPSIASILLINPRQHYLIALFLLAWIFFVLVWHFVLNHEFLDKILENPLVWVGVICVGLIVVPNINGFFLFPKTPLSSSKHVNQSVISFLEHFKFDKKFEPIKTIDHEGEYGAFLSGSFLGMQAVEKPMDKSWNVFLKEHSIKVVIATQKLIHVPQLKNDPDFQLFLKRPDLFGFSRYLAAPNTEVFIADSVKAL